MALSPKRRKLNHESSPATNAGEDGNEEVHAAGQTSTNDKLARKQIQAKLARPVNNDESALYSGGQYKSNIFKLQVDEMLVEVRPNYERKLAKVDEALQRLNGLIEKIEDRKILPILEATEKLQKATKITIPYPDPKPDKSMAYKLAYSKPSKINVVGSYATKTMVKSEASLSVDMIVVMPKDLFQDKDFLNYRYFYKRAYYLACITAGLKDAASEEFDLKYSYLSGNTLHPILVVKPKAGKDQVASNFAIHIIPAAPTDLFVDSKLQPFKNCIRIGSEIDTENNSVSPFYNASIKSDCNSEAFLQLVHQASKYANGFTDSCILGRVWLRQRGFTSAIADGGFGSFEWSVLTALLLLGGGSSSHKTLSKGYSSYQMFKAVVQFLATSSLINKPHIVDSADLALRKCGTPIFYDGKRNQNILYKMSGWSYELLREEARTSVDMLNETAFDQFESTFILRTSQPMQRFDCWTRVKVPAAALGAELATSDHHTNITSFSENFFKVLKEGFMDRLKLITIKMPELPEWSIKNSCPTVPKEGSTILVGVIFDPSNIGRLVDHGPSAEEKKKAAKFQKFWGEKAELRRFRDGSILESLVWSSGSNYSLFREIFTYLTKRHLSSEVAESLTFIGEAFDKILPGITSSSNPFDALRQAFSTLERDIKALEGLPLQLKQLSPICSQLRSTSVELPIFSEGRPMKTPANVLIHFEGSGRWPDDIVAIQRTKIAFLIKIGKLLQDSNENTTTRLGLENEDKQFLNSAFLDIIYQSGASFRLRIHNDREQALLEKQIKEKSGDYRSVEESVLALSEYKRWFIQRPLHSQSMSTHCTRFLLLSPTTRLVKSWFARHLLSGHICEEVIELLVVRTFLQPYPWRAPSSTMVGFLRTLLFISRWDWRSAPLIVDFTGIMTSSEVDSINTRLEAWRKIDPGMNRTVIFAGSNHDTTGTAFTDQGPTKLVAARMTALARSACKLVREQEFDLNPKSLFVSSTKDYDFVIHIASKFVSEKKEPRKQKFKNLEVQVPVSEVVDLVGYHPAQSFVAELETSYTGTITFFVSQPAGEVIGGLWNPQRTGPRNWKVSSGYATKLVSSAADDESEQEEEEEKKVELDKTAILSEISRLGGDMISRIEVRS